jgi:predicted O-linked N-acetylglucosamine transferase (SPINDLY family)
VQVSFAGYPASAGVEAIPYRISDRWLEGECGVRNSEFGIAGSHSAFRTPHSAFRTAEQVYLIDSFWCYDPCGAAAKVNTLPAFDTGRVTFGSLNKFGKINRAVLKLWGQLLASVHDSRLLILCPPGTQRASALEFFADQAVDAQRIAFVDPLPRESYLELYHRLDLVLDPFPYNGHSTSLDALWMGVPAVTLAGTTSVSRAGLSILTNLGLPELVAFSPDEYLEIAATLARDLPRLAELRQTLRARLEASVLMDASHFARNIETAYRALWRQWCVEYPA